MATFGCAIVADFKQIDSYFDHSLAAAQRLHHFDVPADARTGYSYMNFHLKHAATSNGSRFVGEAAGFQDYLFGLGIRYALTSGSLAARSILEERDYDELWKSRVGREAGDQSRQSISVRDRRQLRTVDVRPAGGARERLSSLSERLASHDVVEVAARRRSCAASGSTTAAASTNRVRTGAARAIREMKVPPLGPVEVR